MMSETLNLTPSERSTLAYILFCISEFEKVEDHDNGDCEYHCKELPVLVLEDDEYNKFCHIRELLTPLGQEIPVKSSTLAKKLFS